MYQVIIQPRVVKPLKHNEFFEIPYNPTESLVYKSLKSNNKSLDSNQPEVLFDNPPDDPQHTTGSNQIEPKFFLQPQKLKCWATWVIEILSKCSYTFHFDPKLI